MEDLEATLAQTEQNQPSGETVAETPERQEATTGAQAEEEFEFVAGSDEQAAQSVPVKTYAKLRKRAQGAESERDEWKLKYQDLESRVNSFEAKVNQKPEPTMESCDYDEEQFKQKWADWFKSQGATKPASSTQQQQQQQPQQNEAAQQFLDDHYERASALPVSEAQYEEAEGSFRQSMVNAFGENGQAVADSVLFEAFDNSHLVAFALGNENRQRTLIKKLNSDPTGMQAKRYIRKLSKEASFKPKQATVQTKPETIPEGSGNADAAKAQYQAAFEAYKQNPTLENHKKMRSLKQKLNG